MFGQKLLHLQREKSNDNTKTQGDALGYVLLPLWGVAGCSLLAAVVQADDLPQPLRRRVAIGSAPTVGWGPRWVLVVIRADTGGCPYGWLGTTLGANLLNRRSSTEAVLSRKAWSTN